MEAFQKLTINSTELAKALGIPRPAIAQHRARVIDHPILKGLPEPIQTRPRLVWLIDDIKAWLDSRRTFRPDTAQAPAPATIPTPAPGLTPTQAPRRGRLRKTAAPGERGTAKNL